MSNDARARLRSVIEAAGASTVSAGISVDTTLFIDGELVVAGYNHRVLYDRGIHHLENPGVWAEDIRREPDKSFGATR